jgi:hypothetical protein
MENQRNQQIEMVDKQTVNKTNSEQDKQTLKEKKKKEFQVKDQYNFSLSSSGVTPSASSPVCLCLLCRFGTSVWHCGSPPVFSE